MRHLLIGGCTAVALSLGTFGAAQAQTLEATLGEGLLDVMGSFDQGLWTNIAVNTAVIDAGVVMIGQPNFQLSAAASGTLVVDPLDLTTPLLEAEGALGLGVVVQPGGQVHFGSIDTTAVGVVSTQQIASANAVHESTVLTISDSSSAASSATEKTEANAEFSAFDLDLNSSFDDAPKQPVFAGNIAFNNALIDASVLITGSHIEGAAEGTISTLAAGVVSTQTISMGFDGSAFNAVDDLQ